MLFSFHCFKNLDGLLIHFLLWGQSLVICDRNTNPNINKCLMQNSEILKSGRLIITCLVFPVHGNKYIYTYISIQEDGIVILPQEPFVNKINEVASSDRVECCCPFLPSLSLIFPLLAFFSRPSAFSSHGIPGSGPHYPQLESTALGSPLGRGEGFSHLEPREGKGEECSTVFNGNKQMAGTSLVMSCT